ncbi:MAG: hypothetical protein OES24_06105 [Acidimicrobiia bacterium]|nr:hypothetical protein [Acidimicrobiia bacterium]
MIEQACRYIGYEASRGEPNIVVDGSPNETTVLTLTHWPGYVVERELWGDLSAHIVFNYLDRLMDSGEPPAAPAVTNNHFDQDGLVGIHTLVKPEESLANRDLLIDLAAAGDFATYRDRRAARASMVFSRRAIGGEDCTYDEFTDRLYEECLPLVLPVLLDGDRYRDEWAEEDAELSRCEAAMAEGVVTVDIDEALDLAVLTVPETFVAKGGHRFGGQHLAGLHPMAVNNGVDQFRLLTVHGHRYHYVDRYETWVQYRSRRPLPRIDLRPLAEELTAAEPGAVIWTASEPGSLTPEMRHDGESGIDAEMMVSLVRRHLSSQPAAWDPYPASPRNLQRT